MTPTTLAPKASVEAIRNAAMASMNAENQLVRCCRIRNVYAKAVFEVRGRPVTFLVRRWGAKRHGH